MDISRYYSCVVFIVTLGGLEQEVQACWSITHTGSKVWLLGESMWVWLLSTACSPAVGSEQQGGEGLLCPALSSVNEQGMQGTVIRAVVHANRNGISVWEEVFCLLNVL